MKCLKQKNIFIILVTVVFFLFSCEAENEKTERSLMLSFKDAKTYFKTVISKIATEQENRIVKTSTKNLLKNKLSNFSKINAHDLDNTIPEHINIEGNTFQLAIEASSMEQFDKFNKATGEESRYGICVDPEIYWDGISPTVCVPMVIISETDDSIYFTDEELCLPISDDINDVKDSLSEKMDEVYETIDGPLYTLTLDPIDEETPIIEATTETMPYLVFKAVKLKTENDVIGSEEFEIYLSRSPWAIPINYPFTAFSETTNHLFNGNNRVDARGTITVRYPDVNYKNRSYEVPDNQLIYLLRLRTEHYMKYDMMAWEEDSKQGKNCVNSRYWYDETHQLWQDTIYCQRASLLYDATYNNDMFINYIHSKPDFPYNADDPYKRSVVEGITYNVLKIRTIDGTKYWDTDQCANGGLDDIQWKLGLRYN